MNNGVENSKYAVGEPWYLAPKEFVVDDLTEKVLIDGTSLRNGMRVLILSSRIREDVTDFPLVPLHIRARAMEVNRWCKITDLRPGTTRPNGAPTVKFTGVYDDGVEVEREYSIAYSWIVKKSSISQSTSPAGRRVMVLGLVKEAMEDAGCRCYEEADDEIARLTTDKIVKLFE